MIDYNSIDEKCIPMVKYFNSIGLKTKFSCEGHEGNLQNSFYIIFDNNIKDNDIENFIMKFENIYTHSPFIGRFNKWTRKMNGKITSNWMYINDNRDYLYNQKCASNDLKIFKQQIK